MNQRILKKRYARLNHPSCYISFFYSIIQRRRQHVISELLSTERDYFRDLDLLIETFLNPNSISCVRFLSLMNNSFMFV